jgi:very-short-patch-repair endonuclease
MARLGLPGNRENREADFLVCSNGKWGILEINGDTYHHNSAKDHDRGRLFKLHGIKVFEPYEATRCIKEPENVVQEFLELIKQNG